MIKTIYYKRGYKYQLVKNYEIDTMIFPGRDIETYYINLNMMGTLTIKSGYAWDGPSGPAIDTLNFMRGSLVHDALYQLMREGILNANWRKRADEELRRICREDGMSWIRAWWIYYGVRKGAGFAADPKNKRPVLKAPRY